MIVVQHTISLYNTKIFERVIAIPPFKQFNALPNDACFIYVFEGSNNSYSEEKKITLNQGDALMMKCGNYIFDGQPHDESGKSGMIAIHFYPDVLKKIYKDEIPTFLIKKNRLPFHNNVSVIKSDLQISKYIDGLEFYFENPSLQTEELTILKLKELILLLLNTKKSETILEIMSNLFSTKTFKFKEVVEAHIFSPISIADLAQLTNKSLASFKREFKKNYQDSPSNYIKSRRLEKAARLLSISNDSISSIAYDCLFNNVAHFSNSFKLKYKLNPSNYRLSQLRK
ncbi:MAG: AraC-like DNA-binding protein [Urechidicola sp.]